MSVVEKKKDWRVYKPTKSNTGAASKVEVKVENKTVTGKDGKNYPKRVVTVFLVSAKQTGIDKDENATFAWEDDGGRVTIKLGETDIGELLAVLYGRKSIAGVTEGKFLGLFHKNDSGSSSINFGKNEENNGYKLRVTKKVGDAQAIAIQHSVTFGEAAILKVLLEAAVNEIYEWH